MGRQETFSRFHICLVISPPEAEHYHRGVGEDQVLDSTRHMHGG
jgi:hypothetical protein